MHYLHIMIITVFLFLCLNVFFALDRQIAWHENIAQTPIFQYDC